MGEWENEEKEEPIGWLLRGERCDTPIVVRGEWRMGITRVLAMFTCLDHFGVFNTNELQKLALVYKPTR